MDQTSASNQEFPFAHRYLAIVDDHAEGAKHPDYVTREQFGFPNYQVAEKNLFNFFQANQQYLFAYETFLTNPSEVAVLKKVIQHFYNNFGQYADNLMGISNFFKNMPEMAKSLKIDAVENAARAYIIGAGPSLDALEAQLLDDYKEKQGVFICVDAAYKKLLKLGIKPHIVISSERVEEVKYFYENLTEEDIGSTIGLFNAVSYPPVVSQWPAKQRAFFVRDAQEYHWIGTGDYLECTPYTTYAATALAVKMGFAEIVFIGQDFAYGPGGESHAKLGVNEKFNGPNGPEQATLEVVGVSDEDSDEVKMVKSTYLLNMFAQEIEILIEKHPSINFFNTSPFGRRIYGTIERNLSGLFSLRTSRAEIKTKPFPVTAVGLQNKAKKALKEFEKNPELNPTKIEDYKHISTLGYHFLIHPFVTYQSFCYQKSEEEALHRKLFNQTWTKVREDLINILREFIKNGDVKG